MISLRIPETVLLSSLRVTLLIMLIASVIREIFNFCIGFCAPITKLLKFIRLNTVKLNVISSNLLKTSTNWSP